MHKAKCDDLLQNYWNDIDKLNRFIAGEEGFDCGCEKEGCCIGNMRAYEHCWTLQYVCDMFTSHVSGHRLNDNLLTVMGESICAKQQGDKLDFAALCSATVSSKTLNAQRNFQQKISVLKLKERLDALCGTVRVATVIGDNIDCTLICEFSFLEGGLFSNSL